MSAPLMRWEEPSPARRGPYMVRYRRVAAALRESPGRWAVIFEGSSDSARTTVYHCRRGMKKGFDPLEDFEFECRVSGPDGKVYARYIGETPP